MFVRFSLLIAVLSFSAKVSAKGLNRASYEEAFGLQELKKGDLEALEACLKSWGKHPFKTAESRKARVIGTTVKIAGIGDSISDSARTSYPQLIFIKPSIRLATKDEYKLMNPNGWYCFKANVMGAGKFKIRASCKTKISDGEHSVSVMAKTKGENSGVTVLGKTEVVRDDC